MQPYDLPMQVPVLLCLWSWLEPSSLWRTWWEWAISGCGGSTRWSSTSCGLSSGSMLRLLLLWRDMRRYFGLHLQVPIQAYSLFAVRYADDPHLHHPRLTGHCGNGHRLHHRRSLRILLRVHLWTVRRSLCPRSHLLPDRNADRSRNGLQGNLLWRCPRSLRRILATLPWRIWVNLQYLIFIFHWSTSIKISKNKNRSESFDVKSEAIMQFFQSCNLAQVFIHVFNHKDYKWLTSRLDFHYYLFLLVELRKDSYSNIIQLPTSKLESKPFGRFIHVTQHVAKGRFVYHHVERNPRTF